jgi:hypothetical protein
MTFAWVTVLLHGPPGRPMTPNGPPFSPNYVHIADVACAHIAALHIGPLDLPQCKCILLVVGCPEATHWRAPPVLPCNHADRYGHRPGHQLHVISGTISFFLICNLTKRLTVLSNP